jgi:hypothetical protein
VPEIAPGSSVNLTFPTIIDGYGIGQFPLLISATAVNLPVPIEADSYVTFRTREVGQAGDLVAGSSDSSISLDVEQVQRVHAESERGQIG